MRVHQPDLGQPGVYGGAEGLFETLVEILGRHAEDLRNFGEREVALLVMQLQVTVDPFGGLAGNGLCYTGLMDELRITRGELDESGFLRGCGMKGMYFILR